MTEVKVQRSHRRTLSQACDQSIYLYNSLACLHTCRVIVSLSYANVCHCLYMLCMCVRVVFSLAFVACTLQRQQQQQQQWAQPQVQLYKC